MLDEWRRHGEYPSAAALWRNWQTQRIQNPSPIKRVGSSPTKAMGVGDVRRAGGASDTADRDQRLIVSRRRVLAERGQLGADAVDALPGAGGAASQEQLVQALGAEKLARLRALQRGRGLGNPIGVEEQQVPRFQGDGEL